MNNNDIGLRIRQLIDHFCDGNNSVFARNIGISEANVRNYLNGTMPKFDTLYRIAEKFETSCDWLITGVGPMVKSEQKYTNYEALSVKPLMACEEGVGYKKIDTSIDKVVCDVDQIVMLKDDIINSLKSHIKVLEEQVRDSRKDCDALRQDNRDIRADLMELRREKIRMQNERD